MREDCEDGNDNKVNDLELEDPNEMSCIYSQAGYLTEKVDYDRGEIPTNFDEKKHAEDKDLQILTR